MVLGQVDKGMRKRDFCHSNGFPNTTKHFRDGGQWTSLNWLAQKTSFKSTRTYIDKIQEV